jgi:antitoxin component YwqK of YwqJK toxin-antitoxin module
MKITKKMQNITVNMMKKVGFIFLLLNIYLITLAQEGYEKDKLNRVNANGQKEGLWIDDSNRDWRYEMYYKNGVLHGIYKEFSKARCNLSTLGEYTNGKMSGTWYYFGTYGFTIMIFTDFMDNKDTVKESDYIGIVVPPNKCYFRSYHPNGSIESEGWTLFWDNLIAESCDYGEWKFYDEKGNLIKTKVYR